METTLKLLIAGILLTAIAPLVSANSYELYCLGRGESINFGQLCNPAMGIVNGPTNICVQLLPNGKICPTIINRCNAIPGQVCSQTNSTRLDVDPPEIEIFSPEEQEVYTTKSILLNVESNERADISFIENHRSSRQWKMICNNCFSRSRQRTFDEGLNDLTIRAIDRAGNIGYKNLTFYIDSKVPRIRATSPKNEFASGIFKIEFEEDNPIVLKLLYGNQETGFATHTLDINTECGENRRNTLCETQVSLQEYDGETITYHFELEDIAGNLANSNEEEVSVDYSAPIINSLNYEVNGRRVNFVIDITEANFDKITYLDLSENPREKTLCLSLNNNVCEKSLNFRDGQHELKIKVYDKAGNSAETTVSFFTDSRTPRIIKTLPRSRSFASGDFEVEIDEQNPDSLKLTYGNSQTGFREKILDINEECFLDRRYKCSTQVNLDDYDGEEIEYEFTITDLAGQFNTKGEDRIKVDITFPEINSIRHLLLGSNRAEITLEITEANFDKAVYINHAQNRPRETTFCSRVRNNICKKRIPLQPGLNSIDFAIRDKAGNSVAQNYEIFV